MTSPDMSSEEVVSEEVGKATSANWLTGIWPWTRGNRTRPQEDQRFAALTDLVEKNARAVAENARAVAEDARAVEKIARAVEKLTSSNAEPKVDWTSKWTYSKWIHDHTRAETPLEQGSIYLTCLGGLVYAGKYWRRSHHLMRASQLAVGSEDRKYHRALARVTDAETEYATVIANRIRTQGIFAGIGVPLLWLGYIRNKHENK